MAADHPLPGDLVIREERSRRGTTSFFVVNVHPDTRVNEQHPDLDSAIAHARVALAKQRGEIWRAIDGPEPRYERLTGIACTAPSTKRYNGF